jgi:hypothetical protein
MTTAVRRAVRGVRWYLREATGEAKWDRYLEDCQSRGAPPVSRRQYERSRTDHSERHARSRCC